MKLFIVVGGIAFVSLVAAFHGILTHAALDFFVLGLIPLTDIQLPLWSIVMFYIVSVAAVISWLLHQPLFLGTHDEQLRTAKGLARHRIRADAARRARQRERVTDGRQSIRRWA